MIMYLDTYLISQAEKLANGRYAHKVANMVAAYKTAHAFALDSGLDEDVEMFREAQKDLRIFVHKRLVEKTDPDEYDFDTLEND